MEVKGNMKKIRIVFAFFLMSPLVACGDPFTFKLASIGVIATMEGVFQNPKINLKEKNFAAADYMATQLQRSKVSYDANIHALPLEELDNPGISSEFGLHIPEGIGLRLIELGYNVWLHDVAHGGNAGLYQPPPKGSVPEYKMTGRYAVGDNDVSVYLRVISVKTSQVVAQFDYKMPLNKELRDLSKTPVQIFRVK